MPRPSRFSPAEKAALLSQTREQLRAGVKRKDIAHSLGINLASLSSWLREETMDQLYSQLEPSSNPRARSAR